MTTTPAQYEKMYSRYIIEVYRPGTRVISTNATSQPPEALEPLDCRTPTSSIRLFGSLSFSIASMSSAELVGAQTTKL